jgi:uncharacterized C2H2 Zn-finger protein
VTPNYGQGEFYGEVVEVNSVIGKVFVDFSGRIRQMDPDEIRVLPQQLMWEKVFNAMKNASERRGSTVDKNKRVAIYHVEPGRKYKMTFQEAGEGFVTCPRCKGQMGVEPYSRGVKLHRCPDCDFKITSDSLFDADYRRQPVNEEDALTARCERIAERLAKDVR